MPDLTITDEMVEKAAKAICQTGRLNNGGGRCAVLCFDSIGNKPKNCTHAKRIHGAIAHTALLAAAPDIVRAEREECDEIRRLAAIIKNQN